MRVAQRGQFMCLHFISPKMFIISLAVNRKSREICWFGLWGCQMLWFHFPQLCRADIKAEHSLCTNCTCVRGLYLPPASVCTCVFLCAWLPSVFAISLSQPGESWEPGCVSKAAKSETAVEAAVPPVGFEAMKTTSAATTACKSSGGSFFPFTEVGNVVILMAGLSETLSPEPLCYHSVFQLKGKEKSKCAGVQYYNEATTRTVRSETEAIEPLMREYLICLQR